MAKFKKLAVLCLSFLATLSIAAFTACDTGSSVESESSEAESNMSTSVDDDESEDSSSDDNTSEDSSANEEEDVCECDNWGMWEVTLEATCLADGEAQRICQTDPSHIDTETIAARGHDFTYGNGICKCGLGPIFPEADATITYVNPGDSSSGIKGAGKEYDRYEMTEGYYEIETGRSGVWITFSVPEAGQYALYTTDGNPDNVKISRHNASAQYIPVDFDGNYLGEYAITLEDGNLYSAVNCGEMYYNTEWRATYYVEGSSATAKIRFVRIDAPAWQPGYVHEFVYATQINGHGGKLETPANAVPTEVPYHSEYYFDEASGYYRMDTEDGSDPFIYLAITKVAPRLLLDKSLTQIVYDLWGNLSVPGGYYYTGDYLVKDYHPMLISDVEQHGDATNSYQLFINSDGMYPVTPELYTFLQLFSAKNQTPMIWDETAPEENKWLAGCYYYANLTPGSEEYPLEFSVGNNSLNVAAYNFVYCNFEPTSIPAGSNNVYKVSCDTAGAVLNINNGSYEAPFSVYVDGVANGVTFRISGKNGVAINDVNVVIEACSGQDGTFNDTTIPAPEADSDGNMTLTVHNIYSSTETKYYAFYNLTVTEGVSYTLTCPTENAYVMVHEDIIDEVSKTIIFDDDDDVDNETYTVIVYVELPATAANAVETKSDIIINIVEA